MKRNLWGGMAAIGLILLCWQASSLWLDKAFLPTPGVSLAAFWQESLHGELLRHGSVSAYRILTSLALAVLLAVPLGLAMGRCCWLDAILAPGVYLLYPLPKVVFLPVIVVLMGLGDGPKIFLIALVVSFQLLVVTRDAAKAIPQSNIVAMRALNANGWQTFCHLILPCCLPKILTALRITLGTAIAILFFAETFASFDGLGYFILNGMETRNYPAMYAGVIALALLGLVLYLAADLLERLCCRWQKY